MAGQMPFAIVEFSGFESTAIAPLKWLNAEDVCYWPLEKRTVSLHVRKLKDASPFTKLVAVCC